MARNTKQVFVLVKAYPQPSHAYQETVCCAGITPHGEFVRLYPIRYRKLKPQARFDRFDLVEVTGDRPRDDHRPESFHVDEGSIRIVRPGRLMSEDAKAKLWLSRVSRSLQDLRSSNESDHTSLGIVKPDDGSLRFGWEPASLSAEGEISRALRIQASLIKYPRKPLPKPEFAFHYAWESDGRKSRHQIHDWEVQAAYAAYKNRYGSLALDMMRKQYEHEMPQHNLHFFLGTMKAHPSTFIVVGLLRTSVNVAALKAQPDLFDGAKL